MKTFSVVIPILNMASFVERVVEALWDGKFGEDIQEIIFVCDKSTDGTEMKILELKEKMKNLGGPDIVLVQPAACRGHFQARYMGAKAAKASKVFFIDARVTLTDHSKSVLPYLAEQYPAMSANIDIDVKKNIFCLYWQRSHEAIFSRTYKASRDVNVITAQNYDQHRIGTTCFYCSRDKFIQVCEPYLGQRIFSDDTLVQKDLVALEPITMHPDFRIWWEPRDEAKKFLKHLYARGPGFAEYHIFKRRGWLFYAFLCGVLFCAGDLILFFYEPLWALGLIALVLLAMASTTLFMARSVKEFLILAPLHTASMIAYGLGAIKGIFIVLKARRSA